MRIVFSSHYEIGYSEMTGYSAHYRAAANLFAGPPQERTIGASLGPSGFMVPRRAHRRSGARREGTTTFADWGQTQLS